MGFGACQGPLLTNCRDESIVASVKFKTAVSYASTAACCVILLAQALQSVRDVMPATVPLLPQQYLPTASSPMR